MFLLFNGVRKNALCMLSTDSIKSLSAMEKPCLFLNVYFILFGALEAYLQSLRLT